MATTSKRNGLIELFRFLCSLWVAYFHGFSPVLTDKFNGIIAPVDFFFIVCGLFFLQSMERYKDARFIDGVKFIFWGKNKRFIVPLAIAAFSVLLCNILVKMDTGFNWPLSFLWFFAGQFVYSTFFFFLYKKIKKRYVFNIVCGVVLCLSMSFFKLGFSVVDIPARGPAMLALGILISQIPKINLRLKDENKSKKLTLAINIVGFVISALASIYLAYLPGYSVWRLHLLCCVAYFGLVYFATAIPVYSKVLNFLGEISIFIYLAQCPIILHYYLAVHDTKAQFWPLVVCAALLYAINKIVNEIIKRKRLKSA